MTNVVALPNKLDDLAARINASIERTKDGFVDLAILLSKSRKQCNIDGVSWGDWLADNVNLSYSRAKALAQVGDAKDPVKAIADLREYTRQSVAKSREKLLRRSRPEPGTIIEYEEEDGEEEEEALPDQLPNSMRIRGFLHRAKEAKEMAEADDMGGIKATDLMRRVASEAALAWTELLAKLEGE